jgi:glycosyltransferase involved in cell wall biosynthesis
MIFYIDARVLSGKYLAGVAMYTITLIDALLDDGHTVICISNKKVKLHRKHECLTTKEIKSLRFVPGTIFILFFVHFFIPNKAKFIGANHAVPIFGKFVSLPVIHDLNYKKVPETQTFINNLFQFISIRCSLLFCNKILFVSNYTKQEAKKDKLISGRHKTLVLSNVPKLLPVKEPKDNRLNRKYILCLGSLEPRKNLNSIIDLFPALGLSQNLDLVLIGPPGWKNKSLYAKINASNRASFVKYLGYLPQEEVGWYMKNCEVFCMPSRYEGFGIPQFEALLLGAKVVGSKHSELQFYSNSNNVWLYDFETDNLCKLLNEAIKSKKCLNNYQSQRFNIKKLVMFADDLL